MENNRLKNQDNMTIGYLKVKFLCKTMIKVKELITTKIDICLISESKLVQSFPNQFKIDGCKTFRMGSGKMVEKYYFMQMKMLHLKFDT